MKPGLCPGSTKRPAFTLIELLVVIAILLLLFSIGAAFLPTLQEDMLVVNTTDLISGKLLAAKQRAKRDGKPTGLRLLIYNDQVTGNFDCSELVFIQQPDDYYTGTNCLGGTGPSANQIMFDAATDFSGGGLGLLGQADYAPVQQGDYFEVRRSGGVAMISQVSSPNSLLLNIALPGGMPIAGANATKDWRIIRSPRRLQGEEIVTLPTNIDILYLMPVQSNKFPYSIINSQYNLPSGNIKDPAGTIAPYNQMCQNLPIRYVGGTPFYEILFSPSGGVVGQGTGADKIILWIDDKTGARPPVLLVINVRTGLISVHPALMSPNADPFASPKTGRSSGM